jgi:cob(I)alamin adenosyltransferase
MSDHASDNNGASMVYHELHAVIKRYMSEAPELTTFQVIGALEAVKLDVFEVLARHNERAASPEEEI